MVHGSHLNKDKVDQNKELKCLESLQRGRPGPLMLPACICLPDSRRTAVVHDLHLDKDIGIEIRNGKVN